MALTLADRAMRTYTADELETKVAYGNTVATPAPGTVVTSMPAPGTGLYSVRIITRFLALAGQADGMSLFINGQVFMVLPTVASLTATPVDINLKISLTKGDILEVRNTSQGPIGSIYAAYILTALLF